MQIVPAVDVYAGGFTCCAKSNLNSATRSKRISPCQTGEHDTGQASGSSLR